MTRQFLLATDADVGEAPVTEPSPAPVTTTTRHGDEIGPIRRRTIDTVLIAAGAVVALVLFAAGALLTWGNNFAEDYVGDELTSQNIFFPDQASLEEEGRDDLVKYADEQVTTGAEAEAYASFINGHLEETADGLTYAELGGPLSEARAELDGGPRSGRGRGHDRRAADQRRRAHPHTRHGVQGRDAPRPAALDVRLVDDRAHRRHRRNGCLHRRRGDGGARRPRDHPPAPDASAELTPHSAGGIRKRAGQLPGPLSRAVHTSRLRRRDRDYGPEHPLPTAHDTVPATPENRTP